MNNYNYRNSRAGSTVGRFSVIIITENVIKLAVLYGKR
jgi:hypothetical protein